MTTPLPSRGGWEFHDVTQDQAFWPLLDSISISQSHPDGLAVLECEVVDEDASLTFEHEDEAYVKFDGTKVWAGHLRVVGKETMSEKGPRTWRLTGQDYTALLDDSIIGSDVERPRELVATRVAWILTKLGGLTVTTDGVNLPSEYVDAASFEGTTVREALESTADELSLHLYLDFDKDLHMFRTETVAAPFSLSTSPNHTTSFPFSGWSLVEDSTELTNWVRVKGKRHVRDVKDQDSIDFFDGFYSSIIVDDSLVTVAQVIAAGRRRLNQLAWPVVEGHLVCWQPGLQAGMALPVVNSRWGISETYVVSGVEITAVDPHGPDGKAYLRTAVTFTDRRRVGRYPGGRGDKERIRKSVNKRTRSDPVDANLGGCCTPVPVGDSDLTEYGGTTQEGPVPAASSSGSSDAHAGGNTTSTLAVPDGSNRVGRSLLAIVRDTGAPLERENLQDEMEAVGWDQMLPTVGSDLWYRRIDGTEGYASTGAESVVSFTGAEVNLASVALLFDALYDEGPSNPGPWYRLDSSSTTDPEGVTLPTGGDAWPEDAPAIVLVIVITDGSPVTAGPAGYSHWADDDTQAADGLLVSVWYKALAVAAAEDPGAVTTADSSPEILTLMLRGGLVSPFGHIVPGPTWVGMNPFEPNGTLQEPAWTVTDGDLVVTADAPDQTLDYLALSPPDLPTQLPDWEVTVPFELGATQSLTDDGARRLRVIVVRDGVELYSTVYLGDSHDVTGVSVEDDADVEAVAIAGSTPMLWKFGFDGTTLRAKLWAASGSEPDWQVSTTTFDETDDEEGIRIVLFFGDESGETTLTMSPWTISGGALPGEAVDWEVVPTSGAVGTTRYPYAANTLQVRVDAQVVNGFAETSPDAGTFTLSQDPYVDPADATGSSVVEARYTRA